jgi:hypothetical protein
MPLPLDGGGSSKSSHSNHGGLCFPTLSNVASLFLVAIDVISPLPFPISLELSGPSRVSISLVLNP